MAAVTVARARIRGGVWEAVVTGPEGAAPPALDVLHDRRPLPGASFAPEGAVAGVWLMRVPIPPDLLSDGVQTFLVVEREGGRLLDRFRIVLGEAAEGDLRADLDLLRAELDLLKAAFRRHCAEAPGNVAG